MLEIHIGNPEVTDSVIPINWCVSKETLATLAERGCTNPQIVIVVSPEGTGARYKEFRKVVPLSDLMTYVEFRTPGKNNIWAYISEYPYDIVSSKLLRQGGQYIDSILNMTGTGWGCFISDDDTYRFAEPISVDVPKECFAKEPSELEKAWVNMLFRTKAVDQCDFRRRRLFAYTIQPLLMVLSYIIRIGAFIVALGYGSKDLTFKFLLHPLTYNLGDLGDLFGPSVFIRSDSDAPVETMLSVVIYIFRRFGLLVFSPICLGLIFLLWKTHVLLQVTGFAAIIFVAFLVIVAVASGLLKNTVLKFLDYFIPQNRSDQSTDEETLQFLVCDGNPKPVSVSKLPARRRSFKLRFAALKAKVCKPFSA